MGEVLAKVIAMVAGEKFVKYFGLDWLWNLLGYSLIIFFVIAILIEVIKKGNKDIQNDVRNQNDNPIATAKSTEGDIQRIFTKAAARAKKDKGAFSGDDGNSRVCSNCGIQVKENEKFCHSCGAELK